MSYIHIFRHIQINYSSQRRYLTIFQVSGRIWKQSKVKLVLRKIKVKELQKGIKIEVHKSNSPPLTTIKLQDRLSPFIFFSTPGVQLWKRTLNLLNGLLIQTSPRNTSQIGYLTISWKELETQVRICRNTN